METGKIRRRPLSAKARYEKVVSALFQVPGDEIAANLKAEKLAREAKAIRRPK
jgi:hypothetical protein